MNKLYTLIVDFREGTYISQIKAANEKEALIKGIVNLKPRDIKFLGDKVKQKMLEEAIIEDPIQIKGNQNVFMVGLSPMGYFTTVHIILTESLNE